MSDTRETTARRFLDMLFGPILSDMDHSDQRLLIWSAPSKRSSFFIDTSSATFEAMSRCDKKEDVYFGCGSTNTVPRSGRGLETNITAIFGCWADIDVEYEGMKKGGKPRAKDFDAAFRVLKNCRLEPSVVVKSGHGLQPYWLFKEPWYFFDDDARNEAREFVRLWDLTVRHYAMEDGWTTDTVFDLSRVFRVPGTVNYKATPVPVELLVPDEGVEPRRYGKDDFEEVRIPESKTRAAQTSKRKVSRAIDFALPDDLSSEQPECIEALCENDVMFKRTWLKQRDDELEDNSASGYDLSIATQMCMAGFPQKEIFQVCYAWRSRFGAKPEKLKRSDYWAKTISLAMASAEKSKSLDQILDEFDAAPEYKPAAPTKYTDQESDGHVVDQKPGEVVPPTEEPISTEPDVDPPKKGKNEIEISDIQRAFFKSMSDNALYIQIDYLLQHGRENARFSLVMADGTEVPLGERRQFKQQADFLGKISQVAKVEPTPVDPKAWPRFINKFISMAVVDENPESDRGTMIQDLLGVYLADKCVSVQSGDDNFKRQVASARPFIMNDSLWVHNATLLSWLNVNKLVGSAMKKPDIDDMLRCSGFSCAPSPFSVRVDGARVSRRYWCAPLEVLPDDLKEVGLSTPGHCESDRSGEPSKVLRQDELFSQRRAEGE